MQKATETPEFVREDCRKQRIAITRDGKLQRFVELDDPREQFCECYNRLCDDTQAVPAARVD